MPTEKLSLTIIAATLSLAGCATDSPLRLKADDRVEMELRQAQGARRPALAQEQLAELRQAVRSAQPAPIKPVVEVKRFTLAVKGLTADSVYQAIGEHAGLNVIVAPDIKDSITINLKNVTPVEAMEALRDVYGYEFEMGPGRVFISKPRLTSKTFQLDYLVGSRAGRSEVKVSASGVGDAGPSGQSTPAGGGQQAPRENQEGSKVTTTIQTDFWRTIESVLKSILGSKDGQLIVINPQSGLVYAKAYPAQLREIDEYLERTQLKISRQVVLEAKIIQVTLSEGSQGGINWAAFDPMGNHGWSVGGNSASIAARGGSLLGQQAAGGGSSQVPLGGVSGLLNAASGLAGGGLGVAFTGTSFAALMNFLKSQGEARVLSAPRVATLNNQKAILKVGTDEYFVTNVSSTSVSNGASSSTSPSINVQPFFSGIALDVTPQIDDQGYVTLHVHPSVSDVSEKSKVVNLGGMGIFTLPLASSNINESDTVVRLLDGDIVAIGGLMSTSLQKDGGRVPLAGDVPLFGELFKQHRDSYKKTELVILIKPTVINKPSDWTSANPLRGSEAK